MVTWLSPNQLDLENFRFRGMRPQRGGFDNALWRGLQARWQRGDFGGWL